VTDNVYLVLSEKPDHISREDYHRWYVDHAQENIESTGFVSAQRYSVQEIAAGEPIGPEKHLALYHYDGPMSVWRTDLNRRLADGTIVLPDFFKQIKFQSWACTPVGGLLVPRTR
jgi:hypothetical protein